MKKSNNHQKRTRRSGKVTGKRLFQIRRGSVPQVAETQTAEEPAPEEPAPEAPKTEA